MKDFADQDDDLNIIDDDLEDNLEKLDDNIHDNTTIITDNNNKKLDKIDYDNKIEDSSDNKQEKELESSFPDSDSKFFAIRITGGQENLIANIIQNKINTKKIGVRSVLLLENFKGYIIVEAPDSNIAYEALIGIRHIKGQIRGDLPFTDIERYLVKKPVVSELTIDDSVEIVAGPFKSMKAKITRVDYEKHEATVVLLDSPYQIPVTVDANYLKKINL